MLYRLEGSDTLMLSNNETGRNQVKIMALVSDTAKVDAGTTSHASVGMLKQLTPLVGIVTFLLAWQLFVVVCQIPPYLLPTPPQIAVTFVDEDSRICSATVG